MKSNERLLTRFGYAAQEIATRMIEIEVGEQIPRISDLSEEFGMGRGTVQEAFKVLESSGALKLVSRGHLGTYIVEKNIHLLLQMSGVNKFVGAMTLPYSKRFEGLATGLCHCFEELGFTLNFTFTRGAEQRIDALSERKIDFAIVSRLAADLYLTQHNELEIAFSFGLKSFVSLHTILLNDPLLDYIQDGMRIGIDSLSISQRELTFAEFKDFDVTYVEQNYLHLPEMLRSKQIDALIWNRDEINPSYSMKQVNLRTPLAIEKAEGIGEAVCFVHAKNIAIKKVLEMLTIDEIVSIQQLVEKGEMSPRY
ncbi:GntR family transcriptional regulator YhfZ [Paenibacillus eucommiae]|uniref:DNA-binding transcriptional regulator n=1 Tax=Paenibacillus eucommiae TaxID=1355755 RepID=A0ABS4IS91_9BACL|nr:GntR family transcriptional regulator YhfZ [Paenibacillus eucommiae]MBP1990428.1 putative DNA-binding transcriptional regulator [Paenibacillus eucommiae]